MNSQNINRPSRIVRSCVSTMLCAFTLIFAHLLLVFSTKSEITLFKTETLLFFINSAACFGVICFLLPRFLSHIFIMSLIFLIVLANCIQICFYGVFATYSTFGIIINGTAALTNFPQIVSSTIIKNSKFLLLMLLPLSFAAISFFIDIKHLKKCKIIQKENLIN